MTALYIMGGILLVLLLLLLIPVQVRLAYIGGGFRGKVRYVIPVFDFSPEALAKRAEKDAEKELKREYRKKKKREKKRTKLDKTEGLLDTVSTVWALARSAGRPLQILRRHLVLSRFRLDLEVTAPDAHLTAVRCTQVGIAVQTGLEILDALFVLKQPRVDIRPDFTGETGRYDISLQVGIRPIFVLAAGGSFLKHYLQLSGSRRKRRRNKSQQVKGGKQHEPTASCQ